MICKKILHLNQSYHYCTFIRTFAVPSLYVRCTYFIEFTTTRMNKNTALFAVLAFLCSSQEKHFDIVRQQYGHQYGNGKVEVKIKYGKSMEQYEISKVRYVNFFGAYCMCTDVIASTKGFTLAQHMQK